MTYTVAIISSDGKKRAFACGGVNDQEALIYAGKVVEEHADRSDPRAAVVISKDDQEIGPSATVADMISKTV